MAEEVHSAMSGRPLRSEIPPRLRHRSKCESENGTADASSTTLGSTTPSHHPFQSKPDNGQHDSKRSEDIPPPMRTTHSPSGNSKMPKNRYTHGSVFSLLGFELTRGYYLAGDETHYEERRERVYTFMTTPFEVEKFCIFGFLQCVDTFLFFAAFLPFRIVLALLHILAYPCTWIMSYSTQGVLSPKARRRILKPAHVCDILKGLLFVLSYFLLDQIDTSRLYHMVRGQAVIKLYVFYNMLDLADRLLSGAGQDLLDSLYWTATEPGRKRKRIPKLALHFSLALGYIVLHTFLILCQAIVLNVAFNSHNKALLTIMISNNFVEIKSSLFKRIDKNNLQQMSCSDVKERFHLVVLLLVVFIRNMTEFNWEFENVNEMVQDTVYIIVAEIGVDWVKHAFITKFNELPAETYRSYSVNLAQDILTSQEKHAHTDHSDQVCRRMGLAPIPLMCLVVQVCSKSFRLPDSFSYVLVLLFCLCLVSSKLLTSILLLSWGCHLLEGEKAQGRQTDPCDIDSQVFAKKEVKRDTSTNGSPPKSPHIISPIRLKEFVGDRRQMRPPRNGGPAIVPDGGMVEDWDGEAETVAWVLHSASDSVVERQSQLSQRSSTPVRRSLSAEDRFTQADNWLEEEHSDTDSDSGREYHNSLENRLADPASETMASRSTPPIDYDIEKKFK